MLKKIVLSSAFVAAFLLLSAHAFNDGDLLPIIVGEPGRKAGDIIQPNTLQEVAAWCDFNKQIVSGNNRSTYICVYNGKVQEKT